MLLKFGNFDGGIDFPYKGFFFFRFFFELDSRGSVKGLESSLSRVLRCRPYLIRGIRYYCYWS